MDDKMKPVESDKKSNPNEELEEILEQVPEEHRKTVERHLVSFYQAHGIIPQKNPIAEKITEDHITQYLSSANTDMEYSHKEKFHWKVFVLILMVILMGFFIALVVILKDNPEVMEKVICTAGGLIAGALGGYGVGRNIDTGN